MGLRIRLENTAIGNCMVYNGTSEKKDTLGAELLSSFRRLSFGGRFEPDLGRVSSLHVALNEEHLRELRLHTTVFP